MRRKDISLEFTNINSKLIEEAAEYRSSNKKLVRVLALAACIAVLVTAIPLALILNREGNINEDPVITEPNDSGNEVTPNVDPVKIIYCSGPNKEELKKILAGESVEIRDKSEIEGETGEFEVDASQVESIPAKLYITVDGQKYSFTFDGYVYSLYYSLFIDERKPNLLVARYKIDDPSPEYRHAELRYSLYNEQISQFVLKESIIKYWEKEHKINEEIAKELADKALGELFGEEAYNLYSFESVSVVKTDAAPDSPIIGYKTEYHAYVNGYRTSQSLYIYHDIEGSFSKVIVSCQTKIDILENLAPDAIKEAEETSEKLFAEILEGKTVVNKSITVQSDDKAYWCYTYWGKDEFGCNDLFDLYYPIG